ncbi:MAG TPA: protein kinase [Firmicutes bacterium]|nr:protein kinase [Bacillota bacterium]
MNRDTPSHIDGSSYRDKSDFYRRLNENYDNIVQINSGGGGIIYSGIHKRLGQKVVLKKIRTDRVNLIDKDLEIKILLNLKHTYLPRILDFWSYNDEVYTVMEYIEGKSLKECIEEGRKFSEKEVIRLTRQLAEVLKYLHESSLHIIHGDIKPANIMLTPEDNICLIDFNVSVLQSEGIDSTIGYSDCYAPVEQLIAWIDHRTSRQPNNASTINPRPDKTHIDADAITADNDDERTTIDADRTMIDADRTAIDAERTMIDADRTAIDAERTMIDADRTEIDDGIQVDFDKLADELVTADSRADSKSSQPSDSQRQTAPRPRTAGSGVLTSSSAPSAAVAPANSRAATLADAAARMTKKYGHPKIDYYTDIYSACATMYQLLCGHKPNPCYEQCQPIEKYLPGVNEAFARIIERGMNQDPSKRYRSADELLRALGVLAKSDRKYRRMRVTQDIVVILLFVVFALGALAAYQGGRMKLTTHSNEVVNEAYSLYESGDYTSAVELLEGDILEYSWLYDSRSVADAYYIIGSCRLSEKDYVGAVEAFRSAIFTDSATSDYYRDYGIALALSGDTDRASEALLQAEALGLADDSMLLLSGEINAARGDFEAAIADFINCLSASDDRMILVRAGIRLDELLSELQDASRANYDYRIGLMRDLYERVMTGDKPDATALMLVERLAQLYIDAAEFTGDGSYDESAIELYDIIIDSGYASLTEHIGKAVCLQRLGRYDEARELLLDTAESYPDEYEIYKRLAFLEVDYQYTLDIESRSYVKFAEYYEICMSLYERLGNPGQDAEIAILEATYKDAVDKGWI